MKPILLKSIAIAALFLLASCGNVNETPSQLDSPSREGVTPTNTAIPQVFSIISPRLCTATIIGDKVALTAAHCLKAPRIVVNFQNRLRMAATKFVTHGPGEKYDPRDVGLIYFDRSIVEATGVKPLALADDVKPGETVTFIGYGCNQRAMGTHRLYRIRDYLEFLWSGPVPVRPSAARINGPANRAQTCPGDSGSPALVNRGGEYQVVGVLHGLLHESTSETFSVFSDVSRGANRDFIQRSSAP